MPDEFKVALERARLELLLLIENRSELQKRRQAVDDKILALKQTIAGLIGVIDDSAFVNKFRHSFEDIQAEEGLKETCSGIMRVFSTPKTTPEIVEHLEAMGFDLTRYTSPLSAVSTTVKRMVDSGEVIREPVEGNPKKFTYRWDQTRPITLKDIGPPPAPSNLPPSDVMRPPPPKRVVRRGPPMFGPGRRKGLIDSGNVSSETLDSEKGR